MTIVETTLHPLVVAPPFASVQRTTAVPETGPAVSNFASVPCTPVPVEVPLTMREPLNVPVPPYVLLPVQVLLRVRNCVRLVTGKGAATACNCVVMVMAPP